MLDYAKVNRLLAPADQLIDSGLSLLKTMGMYDSAKQGIQTVVKTSLKLQFSAMNDLSVYGLENLPAEGGAILAANHTSWLDAQVLTVASSRPVSFVAKDEFVNWPLLRHVVDLTDGIFIKRGGDEDGLATVVSELKKGTVVGIFPEGTIPGEENIPRWDVCPETGLLRGKSGVVRLAIASGVPIVPVGISGAGRALPPETYPRLQELPPDGKARIEVRFGEPMYFRLRKGETLEYGQLRGMTRRVMSSISHLVDHSMGYQPKDVPIEAKEPELKLPTMAFSRKTKGRTKAQIGVLVLHGFTSHVDCVADLRHDLDKMKLPYRFPWLRGHGTKWEDLEGVTARDWYDDARAALLDLKKECKKVVVVGLSMGGLVALDLAAHHRQDVVGLVSIAGAMKFKDPLAFLSPAIAKAVRSWPSPNSYVDSELKEMRNRNYSTFPTDAFASLYRYGADVENRLSFVEAPSLVIATEKDQIVDLSAANTILNKLGSEQKELVVFKESGHEMLLDVEAAEVRKTIVRFLKKVKADRLTRMKENKKR